MPPQTKKKVLYLHERDGKLFVRVPYRDGKGIRRSKEQRVENEREAIKAITQIRHQLGEAGPSVFDGERMTFDERLAEYKRAYPNKLKWYIDPIEKYFAGRKIRSITYGDCIRFKTSREAVKKEVRTKGTEGEVIIEKIDRKPAT